MRIFSNSITIFLVAYSFVFCKISAQTNLDDYDSPTQDWIFGDAPEPKWVTALLKGSHSILEDTEFILSIPISESAVTYEALVDSNASFEITNDHLIITPKEDFHGYIFVNLKLDMSFILKVNPVNDIPVLAEIESQSIEEDDELILTEVGDKARPDFSSLSKLLDADNLVIFKDKRPKNIPAVTKEEFLEFEKANQLIKFLKEF